MIDPSAIPPEPPRRKFLDWVLGTSAGALVLAVFYPATRYMVPPDAAESSSSSVTLPLSPDDVAPNTGQVFKFGNRPGLLVRTSTNELKAFSAACTHLGCIVQYRPDLAEIWCACHNGHFDLNGRNVSGPPPTPLEEFTVNVRGDEIIVGRKT